LRAGLEVGSGHVGLLSETAPPSRMALSVCG
jgi:hypothetical protein